MLLTVNQPHLDECRLGLFPHFTDWCQVFLNVLDCVGTRWKAIQIVFCIVLHTEWVDETYDGCNSFSCCFHILWYFAMSDIFVWTAFCSVHLCQFQCGLQRAGPRMPWCAPPIVSRVVSAEANIPSLWLCMLVDSLSSTVMSTAFVEEGILDLLTLMPLPLSSFSAPGWVLSRFTIVKVYTTV